MKKNMGTADKLLRVLVAAVIIILYATGLISGTLAIILGILAVVFLITSAVGFCPLYTLFKINTKKEDKK